MVEQLSSANYHNIVIWADFYNSRVSRVDVHLSLSVKIFLFTYLTNFIKKSAHLVHECGQSKQLLFNVFGSTDSRTAFYLFDNVEIGYLQGNSTHSPEPKILGSEKQCLKTLIEDENWITTLRKLIIYQQYLINVAYHNCSKSTQTLLFCVTKVMTLTNN